MKSLSRLLLVMLVFLLGACSSTQNQYDSAHPPALFGVKLDNANAYLALKLNAQSPTAQNSWQLFAVLASLQQGELARAQTLLDELHNTSLSPEQQQQLLLLRAQLELQQQHPKLALITLDSLEPKKLAPLDAKQFYLLQSKLAFAQDDALSTAKALIHLDELTQDEDQRKKLQQRIWDLLSHNPAFVIESSLSDNSPQIVRGWFELAAILNQYGGQPDLLLSKLENWKQSYPNHPARHNMPANLEQLLSIRTFTHQNVAVLLPLSGPLAPQGIVIQNGILSAYKQDKHQGTLTFYDSNTDDLTALHNEIIRQGAHFVLGPLVKERVNQFTQLNQNLPELALNVPVSARLAPQLFYFGLTPEDEAIQAANKIWQDGHRSPVIIASNTLIGKRLATAFTERWQQLSHQQPERRYFQRQKDIQQVVKDLLGVTQSKERIRQLKMISGLKLKAEPRNRRDTDAIYLVGSSSEALMVKPFVDVSVSPYAGKMPIYASSFSRISRQSQDSSADMNGLQISEMPWLLGQDPQLMKQTQSLWPALGSQEMRLFGLGYDAFNLIEQLAQLRTLPNYKIFGLTGSLSVNSAGVIQRQLDWAHYHDGQLIKDDHEQNN